MAAVVTAGGTAAAAYAFTDTKFQLYGMALPAVRVFDAETSHKLTIQAAKYGLLPSDVRKDDPRLHVHLWGRKFTNPIGVAAGFDKDAEAMDGVLGMGVGFMEVGELLRSDVNVFSQGMQRRELLGLRADSFPNTTAQPWHCSRPSRCCLAIHALQPI